jgi:ribosomal protein S18 acetylase RimI-like enzyme
MSVPDIILRPLSSTDREWIDRAMVAEWGAPIVVVHATVYRPAELPGFAAEMEDEVAGLLTYHIEDEACEIVTLNSWREGLGVGTALIEAAQGIAVREKCRRLWLVTTNDNTPALRFYQKRGFVLAAVHLEAVAADRELKPEIPLTGLDGILIRDELELEIVL